MRRETKENTTPETRGEGWYGFDLDGTLATFDGTWRGVGHIGRPVKDMVDLAKRLHGEGKVVKIFTARVAPAAGDETAPNPYGDEYVGVPETDGETLRTVKRCPWLARKEWHAVDFIRDWCYDHLGFVPEVTHEKDHLMLALYDDHAKQVVTNEGVLVEDELKAETESSASWKEVYVHAVEDKGEAYRELARAQRHLARFYMAWIVASIAEAVAVAAIVKLLG